MTGISKAQWPRFAAALIVLQVSAQLTAAKIFWLSGTFLPLSPSAIQSLAIDAALVAVAVSGSWELARQSRQRGEGGRWLFGLSLLPAAVCMMLMMEVTRPMVLYQSQGAPASFFLLKYINGVFAGLVWCVAVMPISPRLWAVVTLVFHGFMAARFAEAVTLSEPLAVVYDWDRKPEAIESLLYALSAASLGLAILITLSFVWRRRTF